MELVSGMVSVVMPAYNPGPGLSESARSVLSQTYRNIELILVDDGSNDGSAEECDRLAVTDPRVVVIHQANAGVSAALNAGITRAQGEYVAIVAADDTIPPGVLAIVIPRLDRENADFACFGMTFVYHDRGRVLKRMVLNTTDERLLDSEEMLEEQFFELFKLNYWSSVCNKTFRTKFLRDHHLKFDSRLAVLEDLDFMVRALTKVPRVLILPEALYDYRHDIAVESGSRRPAIDYLHSFQILDTNLHAMAEIIGLNSDDQRSELSAMALRFYLIGMELMFTRSMGHAERFKALSGYATDESVVRAARDAGRTRRGVGIVAACIRGRHLRVLYVILFANRALAQARRVARVTAVRARAFSRG